jgi:hypothetical protein
MNALMAANLSHIVQSKDMCGEPARSNSYEETWQHSVVLTGLEPGEHYTYSVGEDPETYWFIAAPPVGSAARTSFVMYGDMGISSYRSAKAPGYASASSASSASHAALQDGSCQQAFLREEKVRGV